MKGRHGVGPEPRGEVGIALHRLARRKLGAAVGVEGPLCDHVTNHADARDRRAAIGLALQIVGLDQRRVGGIGGAQADPAPALRIEGSYAQAEAVRALRRCLPERIGDVQVRRAFQRRHEVHLDVRRHLLRPALEEGAGLVRKGRGDAAAEQHPLRHRADEPVGAQVPIERDGLGAGIGEDAIDVILQVASDAGQVVDRLDGVPLERVTGPDP